VVDEIDALAMMGEETARLALAQQQGAAPSP
jgi:hypothetical protein